MQLILENINKDFQPQFSRQSALAALLKLFKTNTNGSNIRALADINLSVRSGEIIGIIGQNGAGKTTLLKTIAGIYHHDSGSIKIRGKCLYISGLGNGLKPRLSVAENINLLCCLLGLSKTQIKEQFAPIVYFAELQNQIDTKVYTLSQGTIARLLFSIMISCVEQANSDILLVDEVFGGTTDMSFTQKAESRMLALIKSGCSILLATHSLHIVQHICSRAILMEKGRIIKDGLPDNILTNYEQLVDVKNKCGL
ncbi:MAG: ABC transporter ATP-binding protein [Deltaproteobacteria bacterium]|nr:ABC transporter ATP-binding protein [Deltaproteobacteria bacterium]